MVAVFHLRCGQRCLAFQHMAESWAAKMVARRGSALSSTIPELQKGDAELVRPSQARPYSFEPTGVTRHTPTAGPVRCAHMAGAQCGSPSVGGTAILNLVAHIARRTILDSIPANEATSRWFMIRLIQLGIGTPTLHRRLLIRMTFGGLVLGAGLLGYGGEHR